MYEEVHRPSVCELGPRSGRVTGNTFVRHPWRFGFHSREPCPDRFALLVMHCFNPP